MLTSKVSASNTDNAGEGAEATSDDLLAAGATALRLTPKMTVSIDKFRNASLIDVEVAEKAEGAAEAGKTATPTSMDMPQPQGRT